MKDQCNIKKIVWALDAFEEEETQLKIISFLKPLINAINAEIEPVFILSMSGIPGTFDRQGILVYLPQAKEKLHGLFGKCDLPRLKPEKIIVQGKSRSIRNDIKTLLDYAHSTGAQVIVTGTHARKGVSRFFMGSFAETLLLTSDIPIIACNPSVHLSNNIRSLLYVTDFSSGSELAFRSVLIFAKQLNSEITLFYQHEGENIEIDSDVLISENGKWSPAEAKLLNKNLLEARRKAADWQNIANQEKVSSAVHFGYGIKNVAEAALEMAQVKKTDMIAIASIKNPAATLFAGSTSRWIVRGATCPVWVLHVSD
ncbi:MAG: universal stress protein [Bacteriovorax sp.]|jgi:nucleotide-binding universal stress UspA family protein